MIIDGVKVTFHQVPDTHFERAYEVRADGENVGIVKVRADGQWTATSLTGWQGNDFTRRALVTRMVRYGQK